MGGGEHMKSILNFEFDTNTTQLNALISFPFEDPPG